VGARVLGLVERMGGCKVRLVLIASCWMLRPCGHLLRSGSVHALLAAHRRTLFPDELFADLFLSGRGRPSVPADVAATVMVLQALEAKSDRALDREIAWKAAAGLALTDEGFHPTVLTLWRI
jgi:Transposase domain (DUF772)